MHSRERRVSRVLSEEVVAKVGVEGIADAKAVEVAEGLEFGTTAVRVRGFECPLHSYVSVFVEGELCSAATEVKDLVVAGSYAAGIRVAPGCTALLTRFESKRRCCRSGRQERGESCESEPHNDDECTRDGTRMHHNMGNKHPKYHSSTLPIDITSGSNAPKTLLIQLDKSWTLHHPPTRSATRQFILAAKTGVYSFQEIPRRTETTPMGVCGLAGDHLRAARSLAFLALQVNLRIRS